MHVQTYSPQHPQLKKYISYYYFLRTDDPAFEVNYYSFPNTTTPLNIHKNVHTKIGYYSTDVYEAGEGNTMIIQGMRKYPLSVRLHGKIDKITIHFKPLGINNFIKKPFIDIAPCDTQLFNEWDNEAGYNNFLSFFYSTTNLETRVTVLENFLLTICQPLPVEPVYEKAIAMLMSFEGEMNINEIVSSLRINSKALHRFFYKHMGISPAAFKKIARFRHSIDNKLMNERREKRLTDICYESNFYDQSYFTNVYKEITGLNPKSFFHDISRLAENRLVLKFLQ